MEKKLMNFQELVDYTGLSKSYLYRLTSKGVIPAYRPFGKVMFFDRENVDSILMQNKAAPIATETDEPTDLFCKEVQGSQVGPEFMKWVKNNDDKFTPELFEFYFFIIDTELDKPFTFSYSQAKQRCPKIKDDNTINKLLVALEEWGLIKITKMDAARVTITFNT